MIVVGAGIVGCTVAYELAKAGARVQVLETRAPGQGATRASAGILAPYIEGHADIFRDLGARSLELYDDFIERLRADSGHEIVYQRNGTFELAFTDADVDRLTALSAALWKQGVEARWVPPAAFEDLEPLASQQRAGRVAHPDPWLRRRHLADARRGRRGRARSARSSRPRPARFASIALPGDRVGVQTSSSMWDADRVVLAAGSWSSQITVQDADPVPVKPIRGQLIQLQAEPGAIRRVLWGPDGYLVPWPDGSVLVGSTVEDVGFDERHTDEARRQAARRRR